MQPGIEIDRSDVLAVWLGISPLVQDPPKARSEGLVRYHLMTKSRNASVTIAGGKRTTWRQMAEEGVDKAVKGFGPRPRGGKKHNDYAELPCVGDSSDPDQTIVPNGTCQTPGLRFVGAHGRCDTLRSDLAGHFDIPADVAKHPASAYSDRVWQVAELCRSNGGGVNGSRIARDAPFVDGEILHAIRSKYAQTIEDVIARRIRLAFLDAEAAESAVPLIGRIMAEELGWGFQRQAQEQQNALKSLKSMVSS